MMMQGLPDPFSVNVAINPFRAPAAPVLELILVSAIGSVAGINEKHECRFSLG